MSNATHPPKAPPGAASVGKLTDLRPMGQVAVLCLRGLGRRDADLKARLEAAFGPALARSIIARCDDLLQFFARHARRPLQRHSPDCPCLGGDEAAFAHLVMLADLGDRDELTMFAMMMARADMAPCLVPLAEAFVLTLRRGMATATRPTGCPVHPNRKLH